MASLKKCIEEKCKDCTYDPMAGGTWREQVELCRVTSCPLYDVRPVTTATLFASRKARNEDSTDFVGLLAGIPNKATTEA